MDRQDIRRRIGCIHMEDGVMADNLAIALCTYYEDHPECPADGETDENGWKVWAVAHANRIMDALTDIACERRD